MSLGLTRNSLLAVAGRNLIVAGRVDDEPELVIASDLDPTEPVITTLARASLPWHPKFLYVAELDGDSGIEVVVAPMPVTAVAIYGLGDTPNHLHILDLPFEGIDIATGDHDGDGIDEIYVLDPRDERIIEVTL